MGFLSKPKMPDPAPLPAPAPTPQNTDISTGSAEREVNKKQRRAAGFSSTQLSDRTLINSSKQTLG